MCGPSAANENLASSEQSFSQELQSNFAQTFNNQQSILSNLNNTLQPIVEAGPGQQGFTPEELASMNTAAINTTGGNYANAARAVGNQLAGRGDSSGLESGVDASIKAGLASQSAGQLSSEQAKITQANYSTGRQNWIDALSGEGQVAGLENPAPYGSEAINSNLSAFKEADDVNAEKNQEQADIAGGIEGLATDVGTFGVGALAGGADGGGFSGALSGGLGALAGTSAGDN